MRYASAAIGLLACGAIVGCGERYNVPPPQVAVGPHSGTTIRLADDRGFAEFVNEPEVGRDRATAQTSLVVYFLQPDGKTPLEPPPKDVSFDMVGAGRTVKVPLKADPKRGDDVGASRFATALGPYALSGVKGTLKATIDGKAANAEFAGSR